MPSSASNNIEMEGGGMNVKVYRLDELVSLKSNVHNYKYRPKDDRITSSLRMLSRSS
jgi:hypothetical protein